MRIIRHYNLSFHMHRVLLGFSRGAWAAYVPYMLDAELHDRISGFINVAGGLIVLLTIPMEFQFVHWPYIPCVSGKSIALRVIIDVAHQLVQKSNAARLLPQEMKAWNETGSAS